MILRKYLLLLMPVLLLSPLAYASSSDTCDGISVDCMGNIANTSSTPAVFNQSASTMVDGTLTYYLPPNEQTVPAGTSSNPGSNVFNFYSTSKSSPNVGTVTMTYDLVNASPAANCKFTFTLSATGKNQAYISNASGSCTSSQFVATCEQPTQRVVCYINPAQS